MALFKCFECSREVSNKASTCPNCGAPIAAAAEHKEVGVNLTTTQETSKQLKKHIIVSVLLLCAGIIWIVATENPIGIGGLLMVVGLILYLVTRFNIWWHHK